MQLCTAFYQNALWKVGNARYSLLDVLFFKVTCETTSTSPWFRETLTKGVRPHPKTWRWPCLFMTRKAKSLRCVRRSVNILFYFSWAFSAVHTGALTSLWLSRLRRLHSSLFNSPHRSAHWWSKRDSLKGACCSGHAVFLCHLSGLTECNILTSHLIE